MIIAVDFDGTLCKDMYPHIGDVNTKIFDYLKMCQKSGDKIILWTCRCGKQLKEAIKWCKEQGLVFNAVNDNLKEHKKLYHNNCRKIFADLYIDDKCINTNDFYGELLDDTDL